MKKSLILGAAVLVVMSSCGTYTGAGASFGSILGSAIGGIAGGGRGSDIGTIIGMAGGAAIGAAADNARQKRAQRDVHDHYEQVQRNKTRGINPYAKGKTSDYDDTYSAGNADNMLNDSIDASGFDSLNTGDDRLYDFQSSDYTGNYSAAKGVSIKGNDSLGNGADSVIAANAVPNIVILNPRFVDDNHDGALSRGEVGKVIFEIVNKGYVSVADIQPSVMELTGNKHIYISPSVHIESLAPGKQIRYTAMVKADEKLKNGTIKFALTALRGMKSISKVTEFVVQTKK